MHAEQLTTHTANAVFCKIYIVELFGAYVAASRILFHNLIHLKEQKIHKKYFLVKLLS